VRRYAPVWVMFVGVLCGVGTAWSQPPKPLVSPEVAADHKVTFRLKAPKAEKVLLECAELSDLLGGASKAMDKGDDGVWTLTIGPVDPGIFDYTFSVDGLRITDPSSPDVFGNRQGSRGFVEVPGPTGKPRPDEWRDVPHGTVNVHWYPSKVTESRRRLHVWTPPGYEKDTAKKYPVLYLLHGSGDNDSHWMHIGRANVIADNLLADGKMAPMLIVMPDGHAYYPARDGETDEARRERSRDAFAKELLTEVVPLVEANYRVKAEREQRAITGLSMGGGQSLDVGLRRLDTFAWVGAFSAGTRSSDAILASLKEDPKKANERLKLLWVAVGKDDGLVKFNRDFDAALKEIDVKHEYRETEGAHRWSVWRGYLAEFLPRLFAEGK
jgi:enterochelin esterase-like enzyme